MDSFQRLVSLRQTAKPKVNVIHVEATSPEDGMIYLHIVFGFALTNTRDSGCWQDVQLCTSWSFAASPVFNRHMRNCCSPPVCNGHVHSSEKAFEQASLLLCEYLFVTLLAQKRMTRRKGLHLMPLLSCYPQSCQSALKSKCHPAQLRGLMSSGTETLGHLISLCLQDLKQKWWSIISALE